MQVLLDILKDALPFVVGGGILALIGWFARTAIRNSYSPERLDRIEKNLDKLTSETVPKMQADTMRIEASVEHITRQVDRIETLNRSKSPTSPIISGDA